MRRRQHLAGRRLHDGLPGRAQMHWQRRLHLALRRRTQAARGECDDGNQKSGDGCSSDCKLEAGWTCQDVVETTSTVPSTIAT